MGSGFLQGEQGGRQCDSGPVKVLDGRLQSWPFRERPRADQALQHLLGIADRVDGPPQAIDSRGRCREAGRGGPPKWHQDQRAPCWFQ
jgi:hypothetical protein